MKKYFFKNTFAVSLLGHMAVFSIFSLSFGPRIPSSDYPSVSFFGTILESCDFKIQNAPYNYRSKSTSPFKSGPAEKIKYKDNRDYLALPGYCFKPLVDLTGSEVKKTYAEKPLSKPFLAQKKESVVIFHPVMPNYFNLYFKDRQVAHIEVLFNITSNGKTKAIAVKRKIASGNLEVDLLSMRYISHYLFIQQARLAQDSWQKVKIELSPR